MNFKSVIFSLILTTMFFSSSVFAESTKFDFADKKGINSMLISLDSELEPIMGTATGITGYINFDPDNPINTTAHIKVPANQIKMTNDRMTKVLHGEDWINIEKFPSVEFKISKIEESNRVGDSRYDLLVVGEFNLKGISRELSVPINLSYQPGKLEIRQGGVKGDLIILRTQFTINRKDFKIKPEMGNEKVGEQIDIHVGIVGAAPK